MSRILRNFNGGGPKFCTGDADVNNMIDCPLMPSMVRLAFATQKKNIHYSLRMMKKGLSES